MCGIAGFLKSKPDIDQSACLDLAGRMGDTLVHRGPDDSGVWAEATAGIALAHRRLSIVDLSPQGHQPMTSSCGRWVIVFNGEIYNFNDLRNELAAAGRPFRSTSDTEVILEGCAVWGVERTISRLWGMFAIALWDRQERTLYLTRDRLGIKPLYWGRFGDLLVFGSEIKALMAHDGWQSEIDRTSLASYLQLGYIPAPRSIWKNVYKLEPGHILAFTADGGRNETVYWSVNRVAAAGIDSRQRNQWSDEEAVERLENLLSDAVGRHMVADVPLGTFLSGGYDSTAVAALMQARSSRPIQTFTIGFHEDGYDEARHAKAVARHLGTDHTELYIEPEHALAVIPRLPDWYDEPFSDSSQIPTFLVSEMTRAHVTVALSGDGGDELFAGYARYAQACDLWKRISALPSPVRATAASIIHTLPRSAWNRLFRHLPSPLGRPQAGNTLYGLAPALTKGPDVLYRRLIEQWHEPEDLLISPTGPTERSRETQLACEFPDFLDRMQIFDLNAYLPDDILTKVDRASMAVSLETRVPLLDHRIVEFAWALPQSMKVRDGKSKWLLRKMLDRYVPRTLMERPKMGFGVPLEAWLRGPLREWAENLLSEDQLIAGGFFRPEPIRRAWTAHSSGQRDCHYPLWTILMFQAWLQRWA